jgi:hypothetical protein
MGKRVTGDDFNDERLKFRAVGRDFGGHFVCDDVIVTFKLTAQGVGQHLPCQITGHFVRTFSDDGFEFSRGSECKPAWQFSGRVNSAAGLVELAPSAGGVKVFQSEANGIEDFVAVIADGV